MVDVKEKQVKDKALGMFPLDEQDRVKVLHIPLDEDGQVDAHAMSDEEVRDLMKVVYQWARRYVPKFDATPWGWYWYVSLGQAAGRLQHSFSHQGFYCDSEQ